MMFPALVITLVGALIYGFVPGKASALGLQVFLAGMIWLSYALCHGGLRL
jgi:hypothetical protein